MTHSMRIVVLLAVLIAPACGRSLAMTRAHIPHAQVATPAAQDKPPPHPASERRLLALGLSVGRVLPRDAALGSRNTITPLIRFGSGVGIKPSIGFGWFNTELRAGGNPDLVLGRVYFKPVMAGVGYTRQRGRLSGSVSLVGGVSFNRLSRRDTMGIGHEALDIDHS